MSEAKGGATHPETRPASTSAPLFNILIVDDSHGDRRLVQEYLAAAGPGVYSSTCAASLAEARERLAEGGVDLVLLDLGLPDSWGLETLREMLKSAARVPVVVFTGTDDEEQALKAIRAGARDYLVKGPLTKTGILRTIRYTIERYRLENALRESEVKFRTLADYTLDWEYWLGPDREVLYMSPSCLSFTGYTPQEFAEDPGLLERIVHASDQKLYRAHREETLGTGEAAPHVEEEFRIVRRDGAVRWIGHICRPVVGPDGAYRGRRISCRDITERHEAARSLARARDFYLTLLEDFPSPIWRCAPDGRYNWFNRRWLQFTGHSLEQEVGLGAVDRVHPLDVGGYVDGFRRSFAARAPFRAEYRLRAADGAWRWVIDSGHPIRDLEGEFSGYIGTCIDITERKEAEATTGQHLMRMASILEISHHHTNDPSNLLEFSLQQAINLTDSSIGCLFLYDEVRGELILASWNRGVMAACDAAESKTRYPLAEVGLHGEAVRQRHPLVINDFTVPHPLRRGLPEGHVPLSRWMSVPVVHEHRIVAVIGLANKTEAYDEADVLQVSLLMEGVWRVKMEREAVSEVRRLNAELEGRVASRTAELASALRELESFSYSVSHDLRSPLRSLDGFSHALLEEYAPQLDATGRDYLERIRAASLRMGTLIDDLLQLSRVARHTLTCKSVDLSSLAGEVISGLRRESPDRDVTVVIEPGLIVQGDAHLLQIALENLLGNAWKFTARTPGAQIAVGRRLRDGRPEYFVRDNGAGFDQAYADKLFVAFQRLHSAAEFSGTGIGLTIVQRIVRRHGGQIRGESPPEGGAVFSFTLAETA